MTPIFAGWVICSIVVGLVVGRVGRLNEDVSERERRQALTRASRGER